MKLERPACDPPGTGLFSFPITLWGSNPLTNKQREKKRKREDGGRDRERRRRGEDFQSETSARLVIDTRDGWAYEGFWGIIVIDDC